MRGSVRSMEVGATRFSCETLIRMLNLSASQFLHLENVTVVPHSAVLPEARTGQAPGEEVFQ